MTTEPFVWGAGGAQMTPERIAAERRVAQALMQQGMDYSPVQHWTQGVNRVAQALLGGYDSLQLDKAERANAALDRDLLTKLLPGARLATATPAAPVAAPGAATPVQGPGKPVVIDGGGLAVANADGVPGLYDENAVMLPNATAYGPAIAGIETGGQNDPYRAVGPVTRTGARAYGKHQVMDFNIGRWTREVLGRELTPEQFLADPAAQEAVFDRKFGQFVDQHGTPADAASVWFTGRPAGQGANAQATTPGGTAYGPTGRSYVEMFTKNLGQPGGALALTSPAAAPAAPAPVPAAAPAPAAAAPAGASGLNPAVVSALTSPYVSEGTKRIAQIMLQNQLQGDAVTTIDLGNEVGIMDKRGNVIRRLPKGEPNKGPEFRVVRKDEFGNETYGWANPRDQSISEYRPQGGAAPAAAATVTGPDGKPIPIPSGVDPKKFRADVTGAVADALTGKKTEVQAKSEKFGNKMELAERNLSKVTPDDGGWNDWFRGPGSLYGRFMEGSDWIPGSASVGNKLQSERYQQFRQARDNFITALLRDESGAAIGTPEFNRYERELFPQPGDTPTIIKQKAEARRIAIDGMKKAAGPGYKSPRFDDDAADPLGIRK